MKDPLSACGVVLWLTVLITSGCGSRPAYTFDKLDSVPVQEELTEFSLGHYEIPIPVMDDRDKDRPIVSNRFEFVFDLHVLVAPDEESQIAADWERHEGKVRDLVMAICRGARLEELQEPELATLKSHLTEAVQGQLGSAKVRRLLRTDVDSQEI